MTNSPLNLNPSYGDLWWLNGKSSIKFPSLTQSIATSLIHNVLADMYSALGANEQITDVVLTENLLIVRMRSSFEISAVQITIHKRIWSSLYQIID